MTGLFSRFSQFGQFAIRARIDSTNYCAKQINRHNRLNRLTGQSEEMVMHSEPNRHRTNNSDRPFDKGVKI
jgi:hypothetical protein